MTSTNFPNLGDVIPGLTSVVNTAQALVNAIGKATTNVLDSNIGEVVSNLDNLKRLVTHTSEVDIPVVGTRVVGNKLEIEISSDGVAKALGENIHKALKELSEAIGKFRFTSKTLLGSAAATAANAAVSIPKKAAEDTLNGIGNASSIAGNLGNYVGSGNLFGHLKAEIPITVNQEKVVAKSKGYVIPVEFRGVITNDSPANLVFETNKSNVEKPATIYFKGQNPISSWKPNTQLITVTEGSTPNLYQGITNLLDGLEVNVTDKTIRLDQLKARKEPYNIPVKVTGFGLDKDATIQVKVIPNYKDWKPQVTPQKVNKGEKPNLSGAITNLPDDVKAEVTKGIDPNQVGEQTGQVKVTFPDGSTKEVDIPVTVKAPEAPTEPGKPTEPVEPEPGKPTEPVQPEPGKPTEPVQPEPGKPGATAADRFKPQVTPLEVNKGEQPNLPGAITNLPDGAKAEVIKDIDSKQVGNQTGKVKVTFPDGSTKEIDISVNVKEAVNMGDSPAKSSEKNGDEKNNAQSQANTEVTGKMIGTNKQENVLPKTGESNQSKTLAIIGSIVAVISGVGLATLRRSKKGNKL